MHLNYQANKRDMGSRGTDFIFKTLLDNHNDPIFGMHITKEKKRKKKKKRQIIMRLLSGQ